MTQDNDHKDAAEAPADLRQEREAIVRQFLRQGAQLTEELLHENQELRAAAAKLRQDNTRLRTQLASDDAIRELIRKIEVLEDERSSLLTRSNELEETQQQIAERTQQAELEINNLANLYIASGHLFSGMNVRNVVRHISELLQQLVGASSYAIFVKSQEGATSAELLVSVDTHGQKSIVLGEGKAGEVLGTGILFVHEDRDRREGTFEEPLAAIPFRLRDQVVGVALVLKLLPQKERWAPVDLELLKLLSDHAAFALVASSWFQYRESDALSRTLEDIHQSWRIGGSLPPGHSNNRNP